MAIPTFENITKPLTDYQVNTLVPVIIKGLLHHEGKDNAVTSMYIVNKLRDRGYCINDVTLRKCIKHIQIKQLLRWVIADESGFYLTSDPNLVRKQIESLKGREEAIRAVRVSLEKSLNQIPFSDGNTNKSHFQK